MELFNIKIEKIPNRDKIRKATSNGKFPEETEKKTATSGKDEEVLGGQEEGNSFRGPKVA